MPDFSTFSSLIRITGKDEMPNGHLERASSTDRLLTQKKSSTSSSSRLMSALPVAYCMATRRGPNSPMDRTLLPWNATPPLKTLRSAITGLTALRELELNETFEPNPLPPVHIVCLSGTTGPATLDANRKVFDRIVGSSQSGTKYLSYDVDGGGESIYVVRAICAAVWKGGSLGMQR